MLSPIYSLIMSISQPAAVPRSVCGAGSFSSYLLVLTCTVTHAGYRVVCMIENPGK